MPRYLKMCKFYVFERRRLMKQEIDDRQQGGKVTIYNCA